MMRVWVAVAVGFILVTAGAAVAVPIGPKDFAHDASVVTFETGQQSLPVVPGVRFVDEQTPWVFGVAVGRFDPPAFGNQVWSNVTAGLSGSAFSDIGLVFDTPQQAVGGWAGTVTNFVNNPAEQITLRVYDAAGTLLESADVPVPMTLGVPEFVGIARPEGITRVEWVGQNSGFFGVDNFTYGALPEPTHLLAAAAGAMLLLRRR